MRARRMLVSDRTPFIPGLTHLGCAPARAIAALHTDVLTLALAQLAGLMTRLAPFALSVAPT